MKNQKKKSFPRRVFLYLLAILLGVCIAFGVYVNDYYHADPAAEDAMVSDRFVSVTEQNGNWVFAPETPTAGLIFYPGGKVENTAYAPLLHDLAEDGMDESSIKSKNIPTIFLQITGEWPGLSFVFRKSGINTNEIYG